jgi:hypothetical protein
MIRRRTCRQDGDFKATLSSKANRWAVWPRGRQADSLAGRVATGREVFNPALVKPTAPVIQPHLETFVSERLFDDDVGRAVAVDVEGRYCQGGFVRF